MSKTVLVTGASSGIGKATAKSLISKGYKVYVAARRLSKMEELKDLGAIPVQMDITKEEDVQAVVNQIETENGGVDILINNAGFATYGAMEDTTIDVIIIEPGAIKTEFGDVMIKPMLERSGNTAYGKLAYQLAEATKKEYEADDASEPEVIADLILKAIEAKKPKTRYAGGKYAKPLLFIRKWSGDRAFDWIVGRMLG